MVKETKPKIIVLLATYNGEKYLKTQIDSILEQEGVEVSLFVADDKSSDSTPQILEEYQKANKLKYVVNENNKGFTYNFLDLFFSVKEESFDYCAFADQDDFWQKDKLITAIRCLKSKKCELYFSNLYLANQDLEIYDKQLNDSVNSISRYSLLVNNIAAGCTMVMNKALYDRVASYYPHNILYHDYWVFLIALFTSSYYYDETPHILYRQHQNNQVGGLNRKDKKSLSKRISKKLHGLFHPKRAGSILIKELLNGYGGLLNQEDLKYIKTVANYRRNIIYRFRFVFTKKIKRTDHNLSFKVRVLFGRF